MHTYNTHIQYTHTIHIYNFTHVINVPSLHIQWTPTYNIIYTQYTHSHVQNINIVTVHMNYTHIETTHTHTVHTYSIHIQCTYV